MKLVVNGDDFGYSEAINAAIMRCHEAGVLRSASVLVNRPATRAALALARARPTLGLGLHVNLTEGVPVLPPREVPSLVDRRGLFRPLMPQLGGLLLGQTNLDEVERELRAQFAIVLDAGLRPTHVDGHLHAHAFPGVLPIAVGLMGEYGVRAMRSPLLGAWVRGVPHPRRRALAAARPMIQPLLRAYPDGANAALLDRADIVRADALLDAASFLAQPDPAMALADDAAATPGALVEAMTHPAWNRDAARGAAEVALLTDPRLPGLLAERGVRAAHYGEL